AVNLYPIGRAAERSGIGPDRVGEGIGLGRPSPIRAAAKNHASVTVVTAPARYEAVLVAIQELGGVLAGVRAALAIEAFRHTAAYDARVAAELPCAVDAAGLDLPDESGQPRSADQFPATLTIAHEKVETLRYGEN